MTQKRQFYALTSLKGLFILIIAFHNTMFITPLFDFIPGTAFLTLFGGSLGNSVFFVLSGFLLSYGYRDRIMEHAVSFQVFLKRRLEKLYPMYFISNIAALLVSVWQYGISVINLEKLVLTLMVQIGGGLQRGNPYNAPTWFLSALLVCYVVYFFISHHSKSITQYYCCIAFGIIWGYGLTNGELMLPLCYPENGKALMNFFIGCAIAEFYPRIREKQHKWLQPCGMAVLVFALYLMLKYGVPVICGNVDVAFAFVITPIIVYLAFAEGPISKILQFKPFVYLGNISISVFYWHLVIFPAFLHAFTMLVPDGTFAEVHYIMYFAVMMLWCGLTYNFFKQRKWL